MFSCGFCKIFKNSFFTEHLRVAPALNKQARFYHGNKTLMMEWVKDAFFPLLINRSLGYDDINFNVLKNIVSVVAVYVNL